MSTHNIRFYRELVKIIPELSLNIPPKHVIYTRKVKVTVILFMLELYLCASC